MGSNLLQKRMILIFFSHWEKGRIFTCGSGEHGQLGHGNYDPLYLPKMIQSLKEHRVVQADCGSIHTACVTGKKTKHSNVSLLE